MKKILIIIFAFLIVSIELSAQDTTHKNNYVGIFAGADYNKNIKNL